MELREQVRQADRAGRGDHADRDLAANQPGQLVDGFPHPGDGGERGTCVRKRGRPGLGEPDGPAGAVEQRLAELALQPPDLRADPGLGDVHPLGCAREVPFVGNGHEVGELMQFHKH